MPEGMDLGADSWDGRTYYGRSQLKPAPFSIPLVGSYVFLSGLSGAAQLIAALLDISRGRAAEPAVRRGRFLSLLAPTIGAACLIADLHTPQRFYNMLRMVKRTSPMSIGTWILMAFSLTTGLTSAMQFIADHVPGFRWLRGLARVTQLPAAVAGAGMGTYTASLFSATSTPLWAAAPKALSVQFGASSVASAAAAMSLGEGRTRTGRDLDSVAIGALLVELAATLVLERRYQRTGVDSAVEEAEQIVSTGFGTLLPLGLLSASLLFTPRRSRTLSGVAALAILGGSVAMRMGVMAAGNTSARRPDISMRFAQPRNLLERRG